MDSFQTSALAAGAKIRLPCTLKHRVQQEYNNLLFNALNRIFKSNLSLNNFKWLLTKLELSCVRNINLAFLEERGCPDDCITTGRKETATRDNCRPLLFPLEVENSEGSSGVIT